ncbi:MAG: hypothetical protein KKI08_13190, partial [Armatimonadetes bacterium]|nr:hypothetical protein [Armatimonadota bacterium]
MPGLQGLAKAGGRGAGSVATSPAGRSAQLALGGISLLLLAVFFAGSGLLYQRSLRAESIVPGIRLGSQSL